MSDIAIKVENLGKSYLLGHNNTQAERYTALRDVIAHNAKNLARKTRDMIQGKAIVQGDEIEEFWALKDINFEIKKGECVSIIGSNGAGKSTLLKILSRITEPTKGRVQITGRVASLLEVGTGFHPELSGRENIYLNGAILGMSRAEIQRKFDEIVDFAEVEKFLDTPVKRYSSGMYVRLAFAVAAHLEPEILIVDEVLAVGDAKFQKKCLGKMENVASDGRTVLFVSHNMTAVQQLTNVGIVLDKGRVVFEGIPTDAVAAYSGSNTFSSSTIFEVEDAPKHSLGNQAARFIRFWFDRPVSLFSFNEDFSFIARIRTIEDIPSLRTSLTIYTAEGTPVGSCFSAERAGIRAGEIVDIHLKLPQPRLAPGRYYCGVAIGKGNNRIGHVDYDVITNTLNFEVAPETGDAGTVATWFRDWGSTIFQDLKQNIQNSN